MLAPRRAMARPFLRRPLLAALLALVLAAPAAAQTPVQLFAQAKIHFDANRYAEALPLMRQAAEAGNATAQNSLGVMYQTGRGVAQNDRQAVAWYRRAADQGNADAQNNLGVTYANGLDAAATAHTGARGGAMAATDDRDDAYAALQSWMTRFRRLVRPAFRNAPAVAARIGF